MMNESDETEFNRRQLSELQLFQEVVQIKDLKANFENLQLKLKDLQNERQQFLQTQEQLINKLDKIKDEIKKASLEEVSNKIKLDMVRKSAKSQENCLGNVCLLLAYQISKYQLLDRNKTQESLLCENAGNIGLHELKKLHGLVLPYCQHPEFEKIREILSNSEDMNGLLDTFKQFFKVKCGKE